MYPARKNTNINKHKFFHPGSGKNQAKLWASEEKERETTRDATAKRKQIQLERREMDQLKILNPAQLSSYQLKWMYEESTKDTAEDSPESLEKDKKVEKSQTKEKRSDRIRSLEQRENEVRSEYSDIIQKRMRDTETAVKSREDPMALAAAFMRNKAAKK
ncbi:hypothetical protein XU18_4068 [Perkinsela sp. CCAP 1560/4]|nr:hypothetical protein XU18_4068 [Perkinsela sp. CCAP 1560/4]|eukprot:KNH04781.1 hypothetical protein XU18_4068 [Perkinsela sp. CCAP 1560/4]